MTRVRVPTTIAGVWSGGGGAAGGVPSGRCAVEGCGVCRAAGREQPGAVNLPATISARQATRLHVRQHVLLQTACACLPPFETGAWFYFDIAADSPTLPHSQALVALVQSVVGRDMRFTPITCSPDLCYRLHAVLPLAGLGGGSPLRLGQGPERNINDLLNLPSHVVASLSCLSQALVAAAHSAFMPILELKHHLKGARCVVALADSMEARVAYFAPAGGHGQVSGQMPDPGLRPMGQSAGAAGPASAGLSHASAATLMMMMGGGAGGGAAAVEAMVGVRLRASWGVGSGWGARKYLQMDPIVFVPSGAFGQGSCW